MAYGDAFIYIEFMLGDFRVSRFETTAFWTRIVSSDFGVESHYAFQIHIPGGEQNAAPQHANLIGLLHTSESGIPFCSCCSCVSDRSDAEWFWPSCRAPEFVTRHGNGLQRTRPTRPCKRLAGKNGFGLGVGINASNFRSNTCEVH